MKWCENGPKMEKHLLDAACASPMVREVREVRSDPHPWDHERVLYRVYRVCYMPTGHWTEANPPPRAKPNVHRTPADRLEADRNRPITGQHALRTYPGNNPR